MMQYDRLGSKGTGMTRVMQGKHQLDLTTSLILGIRESLHSFCFNESHGDARLRSVMPASRCHVPYHLHHSGPLYCDRGSGRLSLRPRAKDMMERRSEKVGMKKFVDSAAVAGRLKDCWLCLTGQQLVRLWLHIYWGTHVTSINSLCRMYGCNNWMLLTNGEAGKQLSMSCEHACVQFETN